MDRENRENILPDWARIQAPLNMNEAAKALGISRRFLSMKLKDYPHFEFRGRNKKFYPEHIEELRKCLNSENTKTANTTPMAPLMDNALERLSKLAKKEKQSKRGQI